MNIVIVDYGLGNLASIKNILLKSGANSVKVSGDAQVLATADKLILPGVGAFDAGMSLLRESGLMAVLNDKVCNERAPTLGICLGMQLLSLGSEEGVDDGLGYVDTKFKKFDSRKLSLRVPHMGWNRVKLQQSHPVFKGIEEYNRFYFVHSYRAEKGCDGSLGLTDYGEYFTSVYAKSNILGVQFHPEKSHKYGMQIFKNFAAWDGQYDY